MATQAVVREMMVVKMNNVHVWTVESAAGGVSLICVCVRVFFFVFFCLHQTPESRSKLQFHLDGGWVGGVGETSVHPQFLSSPRPT